MGGNTPEPEVRPEPQPPLPIWKALRWVVGAAVAGTVVLTGLTWLLFGQPQPWASDPTARDLIEALKLVLAVVAGFGAVAALVVVYRRQRYVEIADHRAAMAEGRELTKLLNERFGQAVEQLGHAEPAVRLGGVHALANLADDWDEHNARQMIIDVLCSYLRMPYKAEPPADQEPDQNATWHGMREVRHTILQTIAAHLRQDGSPHPWTGHNLNLRGVTVDLDLDLRGAEFPTGIVDFNGATFSDGWVHFSRGTFSGANVSFDDAVFSGAHVDFNESTFSAGEVTFSGAEFLRGSVDFAESRFSDGGWLDFYRARFAGADSAFAGAVFSGGTVNFSYATFSAGEVTFVSAEFRGGNVKFNGAVFSGGTVDFDGDLDVESIRAGGAVPAPPPGVKPNDQGRWLAYPEPDTPDSG